ncbi:Helix-turn-helix domain [Niallia circulans]|uniref:helix-turn-helix domain-containing protein n=1 Tax=Niallia circulans TaxID=1397 RepID=UPI00077C2C89|nr:helix-turn-helix domain-containing protein [Niallia circulans]MDR4315480.1 helix-turn-helix domain-containing protein [Niallia circulans]MED3837274.1 helix-turn-helix domain-containing protein [Niallia circulans]MED4244345.1 helix-turn-helix domain-containing protein [Niallia circulans]MED4248922.1 helix-turn-helix domain-containing protein [Niallia circulans]QKH61180.1 helix-turn-helix domain-containing protein [Niallia circulans]
MKQKTYIVGVLILGIAIVLAAFILSDNFKNLENKTTNKQAIPVLMTISQLSEYLQISEEAIEKIIKEDDLERAKLSSYDTYQFIPYLKIDNQKRFMKSEIDEWLKYKNDQHE